MRGGISIRPAGLVAAVALGLAIAPAGAWAGGSHAGGITYQNTNASSGSAVNGNLSATCQPGTSLLSGGFSAPAGYRVFTLNQMGPEDLIGGDDVDSWTAWWVDPPPYENAPIEALSICDEKEPKHVDRMFSIPPQERTAKVAKCPNKRHVYGGGAFTGLFNGYSGSTHPIDDNDKGKTPDDGWEASIDNTYVSDPNDLTVWAICGKKNPAYQDKTKDLPPDEFKSVTVRCPKAKPYVIGGGLEVTGGFEETYINSSTADDPADDAGWTSAVDNVDGDEHKLTTTAICSKALR
jgi:hypothetical protein